MGELNFLAEHGEEKVQERFCRYKIAFAIRVTFVYPDIGRPRDVKVPVQIDIRDL
jgi:hypothetical protein